MRVLMTGGGTGGHVNPAIAIADTVKKYEPDSEIAFVGTKRGLENDLVPRAGYELYHVDVRGFKRSLSLSNIRAAWLAFVSPIKAKKTVKKFRPDIVIGTGGYACWPVLVAASKLGIPTAVHESNAVPGLAVRKLIPYVDRIYINFAVTAEGLSAAGDRVMQVGCPMGTGIGVIQREAALKELGIDGKYKYSILSFGGSQGAGRMNEAALELMEEYAAKHPEVRYVHACGKNYYDSMRERYLAKGLDRYPNIILEKYIYDMPLQLAAADLVISRSGAITCSELSRAGRAAVLIPSPNVTDNQQVKNATVLEKLGGAVMIEEKDLAEGKLAQTVSAILSEKGRCERMGEAIRAASPGDANELIYRDVLKLTGK